MICNECETVAHCLKHGCVPKQPATEDSSVAQPAPVQEPEALAKTKERGCTDPRVCTYHQACMGKCHLPLTNASTAANLRRTDAAAAPVQVPFHIISPDCAERGYMAHDDRIDGPGVVIFQPALKPLTDEQIEEIAAGTLFPINFARAIEAAHGITEKGKS